MLKEEFIARTGFIPTDEEYAAIERDYYSFDGNKDAFCMEFDAEAAHARRVQRLKALETEVVALKKQMEQSVASLKKQLEREQEWKPCEGGTNMSEEDYQVLKVCGDAMTDAEAKNWLHTEFGFDPLLIQVLYVASTLEKNRHGFCRKAQTFRRVPCRAATDMNYARFNAAGLQWEIVNGEPLPYTE